MIHAILAINNLGYIGKDGKLPWGTATKDLRMFWKQVTNEEVLIGKSTYLAMPQGRLESLCKKVYVASRRAPWTIEQLLTNAKTDIYVIGGKQIYEAAAPFVDVWHISRIADDTIGDTALDLDQLIYAQKI